MNRPSGDGTAVAAVGSELVECAVGFSFEDLPRTDSGESKPPLLNSLVTFESANAFEEFGFFRRTTHQVLASVAGVFRRFQLCGCGLLLCHGWIRTVRKTTRKRTFSKTIHGYDWIYPPKFIGSRQAM